MKKYLVLEDGRSFAGESFGAKRESIGELVFNTGMTGYQEAITDQSYNGEILMFTYPLIGNYGINQVDDESMQPTCCGVVVHEVARRSASWRQTQTLSDFLKAHDIPGINGIDTRAVTRYIRQKGAMRAGIVNEVNEATIKRITTTALPRDVITQSSTANAYNAPAKGKRIVVVDFGLKLSILRSLANFDCDVVVVPASTSAKEILKLHPDGVLLSNGPGDPTDVPVSVLTMIQKIEQVVPLFAICMGHQLFALANGAKTDKMKFGHRGFNHAVKELATGKTFFTSQNHGYEVDRDSLQGTDLTVSFSDINDQTVEGLRLKTRPAFSVQFHPDANPGPNDGQYLFNEFLNELNANNKE